MAGLVPAIHVFAAERKGVDARVEPGHDESAEQSVSQDGTMMGTCKRKISRAAPP